jgi:hemolysin activation/secretion protein
MHPKNWNLSLLIRYFIAIFLGIYSCCLYTSAKAANPVASALNTVDPGLLGQQLSKAPIALTGKQTGAALTKAPSEISAVPAGAEKISFLLRRVELTGNTIFSNAELEAIFKPYLNHTITLAKFFALTQAVTDKYQKAGYFLSKAIIPPQSIEGGKVKIQVLEGYIGHVKIEGLSPRQKEFLSRYANAILEDKPTTYRALERNLLLLNDVDGMNGKAVIEPDPTQPLSAALTLIVKYHPIQAAALYDNYGTRYFGPYETTVYGSVNSAVIPGNTTYFRGVVTNNAKQLQFYELRDTQVLGASGLAAGADGYVAQTHPGFILTPLDIDGRSVDANLFLTYPFIRSRARSLSMRTEFEYLDSSSFSFGDLLFRDRIRDLQVGATYNDVLWKGSDQANLTLFQGFPILDAHNGGEFLSRAQGRNDFTKLLFSLSRDQTLPHHFSLYGLVLSQYSSVPLLAPEQFVFGGAYLGRGFDLSQFAGDEGVEGTLELRLNTAPNTSIFRRIQYYIFYDAGALSYLGTSPFGNSHQTATSAGFGLRIAVAPHINAEGFIARPLTNRNATQVILGENSQAILGYFQLIAYF